MKNHKYTILYHGGSNVFDEFSFESLGTELPKNVGFVGVFDYGWGIYFTEKKEFALVYSYNAVKKQFIEITNDYLKKNPSKHNKHLPVYADRFTDEEKYNVGKILGMLNSGNRNYFGLNFTKKDIDWLVGYFKYLDEKTKGKKALYKVSLSDKKLDRDISLLTFEEKPTPQQLEKINKQLKLQQINVGTSGKDGEQIQKSLEDYYFKKDNKSNYIRLATLFFKNCGIDGIKNESGLVYVIWNDDIINIIDRDVFKNGGKLTEFKYEIGGL